MMGGKKFDISKEEANMLIGKTGLIAIPSLHGMINISSISSILPLELAEKDENKRVLSDGTRAIKKFGEWINELSGSKIDINYYPELKFKEPIKGIELVSSFAKELSGKM